MKEIQLSNGMTARVDDSDFQALNRYRWFATKNGGSWYAALFIRHRNRVEKLYMHRVILGLENSGIICDHKDGDGLNNVRSNLRACTWAENQRNKKKKPNSSSKYIGVSKTQNNTWVAQITHNGKRKLIGTFKGEVEAAKAYNTKKKELHGEFAQLNQV